MRGRRVNKRVEKGTKAEQTEKLPEYERRNLGRGGWWCKKGKTVST